MSVRERRIQQSTTMSPTSRLMTSPPHLLKATAPWTLWGAVVSPMPAIGQDIMPTEERGSIGQVKPTGWHTIKYDCVDGKYLYNRCHLLGYQLTGENANEENLITGTRYLNIEGMLPFENMVADYVQETNNHVLYRVTPIFEESNLLASGVLMEGYSVEDGSEDILVLRLCLQCPTRRHHRLCYRGPATSPPAAPAVSEEPSTPVTPQQPEESEKRRVLAPYKLTMCSIPIRRSSISRPAPAPMILKSPTGRSTVVRERNSSPKAMIPASGAIP